MSDYPIKSPRKLIEVALPLDAINKAMIEIPPKFAGRPPVNPDSQKKHPIKPHSAIQARRASKETTTTTTETPEEVTRLRVGLLLDREWPGATGLAEDVRYYGAWMREEAQKRIGHLYPPVEITAEMAKERPDLKPLVGQKLTVIAWLWARTVKSPNPAFSHVDVPLASSFMLCTKPGKEAYVEPIFESEGYRFSVKIGRPRNAEATKNGTKLSRGANFRCLMSDTPMASDYVKSEGMAGRLGSRLMAVVAEGSHGRVYLPPLPEHEAAARYPKPDDLPNQELPVEDTGNFWCTRYGLTQFAHLFSPRQLVALTTLSDLVHEAGDRAKHAALVAGLSSEGESLSQGGSNADAYADAVMLYLGLIVSKSADYNSTICGWIGGGETLRSTFGRQAIPMVWDYCEANILGDASGSISSVIDQLCRALVTVPGLSGGSANRCDAQSVAIGARIVSTDPPYYDNIGYADLSDFFYVWLRRTLKPILPVLFATLAVPKAEELVATPFRHGGKEKAEAFFLSGMTHAMHRLAEQAHTVFPVTIYYAFKQSETESNDEGTAVRTTSTGWDTFLEAILRAGFAITGTWPVRTERGSRTIGIGTNALASSIVLVCRKRPADAPSISRREFIRELNGVLPEALDEMTKGSGDERSPVAPVDLSQAIIGPGMAVFSKYASVLEADGSPMSVRTALQLINRFLAEDDFDADTQFCLHWFEQHGWTESVFGEADVLARSKSTSVDAMRDAGVLKSGSGKVRLLKWAEYPTDWNPSTDTRTPIWEALHQLIRSLKQGGESASGALLDALGGKAEAIRQLAYRLYTLCERLGQAEDARAYNELITSWTGIESAASRAKEPVMKQGELF